MRSMELSLRVTLPRYDARLVRMATVHVFVTGRTAFLTLPVSVGATTPLAMRFDLPPPLTGSALSASRQLSASSIVGVDLFVEEFNDHGVWCWQRIGSASLYLSDLQRDSPVEARFVHQSSEQEQGRVACSASFTQEVRFAAAAPSEWVPEHRKAIAEMMEDYWIAEMQDLRRAVSPSVPFLDRVHAPRHYTRVAVLPGAAFWMAPPALEADEAWCAHWLRLVCRRHEHEPAWLTLAVETQFDRLDAASDAFHEVCSLICEAACAVVNSVSYISDWVPRRGTRRCCESFDELFVRKSGDCEDGAKAIVEVLRCFQDGVWETPLMRAVQRVCALYVPCGVLGMVDAKTVRDGQEQDYQAHMFMNWIPAARFDGMTEEPATIAHLPWTRHLRVLHGEGTGHVDPTTQSFAAVAPEIAAAEGLMSKLPALPAFVDRMRRLSVTGAVGFYHMHVHLYTDELLRRGRSAAPAAFSFVRRSAPGRFGVAYDDVMRGDSDVVLRPHLPLGGKVLSAIRQVLAMEHPLPRLRYVRDPPRSKVSFVFEKYEKPFLDDVSLRAPGDRGGYVDMYVRPTALLDPAQVEGLHRVFGWMGARGLEIVREYDPNGAEFGSVRLRCYV